MSQMQSKQIEKTFMVHCTTSGTPKATGSRVAIGTEALRQVVGEFITDFSRDSRELMRGLIEQDQAHLLEMFQGKSCRQVYNLAQTRRVDIYLISGVVGL